MKLFSHEIDTFSKLRLTTKTTTMSLHQRSFNIKKTKYVCFWHDELQEAEARAHEVLEDGKKILMVSYGYYAGVGTNVKTVVKHIRMLLVHIIARFKRLGGFDKMVVQRETYRLRGETRDCIDPEYEDDDFVEDENWNNEISKKIQELLHQYMKAESSPFRLSFSGDASLADSYVYFFSADADLPKGASNETCNTRHKKRHLAVNENLKENGDDDGDDCDDDCDDDDENNTSSKPSAAGRKRISTDARKLCTEVDMTEVISGKRVASKDIPEYTAPKKFNECRTQYQSHSQLRFGERSVTTTVNQTNLKGTKKSASNFGLSVATMLAKRAEMHAIGNFSKPPERVPLTTLTTIGKTGAFRVSTGPLKLKPTMLFRRPDGSNSQLK